MTAKQRVLFACASLVFAGTLQTRADALAPTAILYDQLNNPGTRGIASQNFAESDDMFDSQGADDFVVPESGWFVSTVVAPGGYSDGPGPPQSVILASSSRSEIGITRPT